MGCATPVSPLCQTDSGCEASQVCRSGVCVPKEATEPPNEATETPNEATNTNQEPIFEEKSPESELREEPDRDAGSPEQPVEVFQDTLPKRCQEQERRACYTGAVETQDVGECNSGVQFCQADGSWTECRNQTLPSVEVCDGKDNDCNGQVDDGLRALPCTKQQGVCLGALQRCEGAKGWRVCKSGDYKAHSADYEPLETSCDGKDNDCDGHTDVLAYTETCTLPNAKSDCALGHSVCVQNTKTCQPFFKAQPFEICQNKIDDNCDGRIDEATACPSVALTQKPIDYSIANNGNALMVSPKLELQCLQPKGTTFQSQPAVAIDPTQDRTNVNNWTISGIWHLPQSDRHLVVWTYTMKDPKLPWEYWSYFQLFDNQCKPVGSRVLLGKGTLLGDFLVRAVTVTSNDQIYVAMRENNNVVLRRYDGAGKQQTGSLTFASTGGLPCFRANATTAAVVAVNAAGHGIVACHEFATSASVYIRRIDGTKLTFVDSAFALVPASKSNVFEALDVSVNAQGDFLVSWRGRNPADRNLAFYSSKGALRTSTTLPQGRYGGVRPNVMGSDFVWGNEDKGIWYRYNAGGQEIAQVSGKFQQVRQSTQGKMFGLERTPGYRLVANAITLLARTCQGKPCVCIPYTQQDCLTDSGVARAKLPCKMGRQVCQSDGLGWGPCQGEILREAEQCHDQQDNDCDGQLDEGCSSLHTISPPDLHSFDVDHQGNIAALHWAELSLIGHCYRSDRSVKRAAFFISTPLAKGYSAAFPTLRMAGQSGHFLANWRESLPTGGQDKFRLFNGDCMPVTPPMAWSSSPQNSVRLHDVAINDVGDFALVGQDDKQQLVLRRFDKKGQSWGPPLPVDPGGKNCAIRQSQVALHPTQPTGLVLCHEGNATSIGAGLFVRRFHLQQGFLDGAPQRLSSTLVNAFPQYGVKLAIHPQGNYAVRWRNQTHANLAWVSPTHKVLKVVPYAAIPYTSKWTLSQHARLSRWGNDFVVHAVLGDTIRWYRYDTTGSLRSQASLTRNTADYHIMANWRDSIRFNAKSHFLQLDRSIRINPLTFK